MKIRRVCTVTGSRADYGLMQWVMQEIKENSGMELIPVVTGAHLSKKSGYTVKEIQGDGFRDLVEIKISDGDTSPYGIGKSIGEGVEGFAKFFGMVEVDFLLLLGDRFEILSAALAALPYNIPVGHIGGGEISEGVIDDSIRHCLTKLSHLHFPITDECADRIKQLGEESWRITVVGSPRLDFMDKVRFKSRDELGKKLGISFGGKVALVIYHPVTLEFKDAATQVDNLLKAVERVNIEAVVLYPNLDTSSDVIIDRIEEFARDNPGVRLFKNLGREDYLSVLNSVDVMVGNSSSGIVEAPSFRLPVVNVGNRQRGRDHVGNVINVGYSTGDIVDAIEKALYDREFINSLENLRNPFGDGKASRRIVDVLENLEINKKLLEKRFMRKSMKFIS